MGSVNWRGLPLGCCLGGGGVASRMWLGDEMLDCGEDKLGELVEIESAGGLAGGVALTGLRSGLRSELVRFGGARAVICCLGGS